jgi:D-alanyl-D-alanine dipeptidase
MLHTTNFRILNRLFLFLVSAWLSGHNCYALSEGARAKGFVFLHEVDPSIMLSLRYTTNENFVGTPVDGYKRSDVAVMTKQTAEALKKVQEEVAKDGYSLVVYDAYRPQKAVGHFIRWGKDVASQTKKTDYYPRIDKDTVFELGYVLKRSGHSRGSTVDLTLIKLGNQLHEVQTSKRMLFDGFTINFLDDGTVDMGSSFDLFDLASHYENNLIADEYKTRRGYLKEKMTKHGFKPLADEWWHFTLQNEPYPATQDSSYFDFDIE